MEQQEPAGRVRVLTWNVWWRFGPAWRERQPALVHSLRSAAPDVVALQECWGTDSTSQAHEFATELGMHAAFVAPSLPPRPDPPENDDQVRVEVGIGLLSRWPITDVHAVPLPSRHRDPAPVSAVAVIAHPAGPLHVIATCLEWEPTHDDDRTAQAQAVADLATSPARDGALPVVLCGDLNAAPDSPVLRPVRDGLVDAWTAGGGDPSAVTLPWDHPQAPVEVRELIDQRIDHVFVRPGRRGQRVGGGSAVLVGDPVVGVHPSDHRGVLYEITWAAG